MTTPSTQPLTPDELAAIRERAEKATPAPWYNDFEGWIVRQCDAGRDGNSDKYADDVEPVVGIWKSDLELRIKMADANFIAHARSDVPKLLAEVERLNAENVRVRVQEREQCAKVCERLYAIEEDGVRAISAKGSNAVMDALQEAADEIRNRRTKWEAC